MVRKFTIIGIVIGILAFLVIGVWNWYLPKLNPESKTASEIVNSSSSKIYDNKEYKFKIEYPNSFLVSEKAPNFVILQLNGETNPNLTIDNGAPPENFDGVRLVIFGAPLKGKSTEQIAQEDVKLNGCTSNVSVSSTVLDTKKGYMFIAKNDNCEKWNYYIDLGNNNYFHLEAVISGSKKSEYENTTKKVIDTIKFY